MTIVLSSFVKEVIKLPTEVQFIIIKFVILDHLKTTFFAFPDEQKLTNPFFASSEDTNLELFENQLYYLLHYLTALMGAHAVLDNILAKIIEELTFDHSIFESKKLNKFVDFVLNKSIKIHLRAPFGIKLDKLGFELLCHGCCEYTSTVNIDTALVLHDDNDFKFITFLECHYFHLLDDLFKVTENLKLLENLKGLKISITSSNMDWLNDEIIEKLIAWRSECGENEQKRVVLSFRLDYFASDPLFASMFVSKLADLNKNGDFEILYTGMWASESLSSHLLVSSYHDDITLFELLDLMNPLDFSALEQLAQISKDTEKKMALVKEDTIEDRDEINFMATKEGNDFTSIWMQRTNSDFFFGYACSLKDLTLSVCNISYECLNSLPDTLLTLAMEAQ
ncbi:unnamed protein product [Ambrosiozyma monospora]|uniref:Unnamed protein product n=1 Tax=Ambrosiozyma monospora TaxID=43982 RepID=A0ACB5TCH2_AMBMO|nr:unnamed protein product [Ambrosiozyma monospora]